MSIKFNKNAYEHALELIKVGEVEHGKKWDWQAHKATLNDTVRFLDTHNMDEYAQWFLAENTEIDKNNKERYLYPYGDLQIVHRNGIQAALDKAQKEGNREVADAARKLLDIIDKQTAEDSQVH
jgi:hypothetical protein